MTKRPFPSATLAAAVLLAMLPAKLSAQISSQDYARAERFLRWNVSKLVFHHPVEPQWIEGGDRFWYRRRVAAGHEFVYVDPAANLKRPAFDHDRLAASLSTASGNPYEAYRLPFEEIELVDGMASLRFWEEVEEDGDEDEDEEEVGEEGADREESEPPHRRWTCSLSTYTCVGPEDIPPDPEDEVESPDGRWVAFERDENLWVRDLASDEEVQLSTDGEEDWGYAVVGEGCCSEITSRREKRKRKPVLFWSPDSTKIATHRLDERQVQELHLLETKEGRPVLHGYRYALPGDSVVPTYRLHVFDVASRDSAEIESDPIPLFWPGDETLQWSADSKSIFFVHTARGQQRATLYRADAVSGRSRALIVESSSTFVELDPTRAEQEDWRVVGNGEEVVWRSERDGWGHLYLYDGDTGAVSRQLTTGAWNAARIQHVDGEGRWVYFHGYGREEGLYPYAAQLYRVRLEGADPQRVEGTDADPQRLTPEDGHHEISMPESGRFVVDTYSRRETAPRTVLRRPDGQVLRTLEEADLTLLLEAGWSPPEPIVVKARDGVTDLYGFLYRPSTFDPERTYPLVDYIYPGPQIGPISSRGFTASPAGGVQALAELGFVVLQLDALGTPLRSRAFHTAWYGDMADNGIADHIHAIKQLAARHREIDVDRIGIYGHSGGGFASTDAILRHPHFFKVAVSGAGNHDNRSYSYGWGEKYQGLLREEPGVGDNFASQANHLAAASLEGKLLLTYGTLDDNVHPNATLLLVDALIRHNRDFDVLVLPNRNHGYAREPYVIRRTWDYFVEHLLGQTPPAGYRIEPPPKE